jgi:hypothetical protein
LLMGASCFTVVVLVADSAVPSSWSLRGNNSELYFYALGIFLSVCYSKFVGYGLDVVHRVPNAKEEIRLPLTERIASVAQSTRRKGRCADVRSERDDLSGS